MKQQLPWTCYCFLVDLLLLSRGLSINMNDRGKDCSSSTQFIPLHSSLNTAVPGRPNTSAQKFTANTRTKVG